jgi:hypothetical protein
MGVQTDTFGECLDSGKYAPRWQRGLADGQQYGVSGTPAFFINGRPLMGARPFEDFAQVIDDELERGARPRRRRRPPPIRPRTARLYPEDRRSSVPPPVDGSKPRVLREKRLQAPPSRALEQEPKSHLDDLGLRLRPRLTKRALDQLLIQIERRPHRYLPAQRSYTKVEPMPCREP